MKNETLHSITILIVAVTVLILSLKVSSLKKEVESMTFRFDNVKIEKGGMKK